MPTPYYSNQQLKRKDVDTGEAAQRDGGSFRQFRELATTGNFGGARILLGIPGPERFAW